MKQAYCDSPLREKVGKPEMPVLSTRCWNVKYEGVSLGVDILSEKVIERTQIYPVESWCTVSGMAACDNVWEN